MKSMVGDTITYKDDDVIRHGAFMGFGSKDLRKIKFGVPEEIESLPELSRAYVWVWPSEEGCENLIGVPPEWVID